MVTILISTVFIAIAQAKVIFPDVWDDKTHSLHTKTATAECTNLSSSCNEPANYPNMAITNLIKEDSSIVKLLQKDEDIQMNSATAFSGEIDRKPILQNICDTETDYIRPRAARNKKGKFMFIVNRPEGSEEYLQLVKITKCKTAGEECAKGQLLNSGSTACQQEYSDHKLVALSETGE